jgi:N-acetylglucosamine-6-phosphate deacetylase
MRPGTCDLGGLPVQVRDGVCRLADGTLVGSVLTMSGAVRTVQKLAEVSLLTALRLSSLNPVNRRGNPNKGKVEEGYDADLVWLDAVGNVLRTMVGGRVVHEA